MHVLIGKRQILLAATVVTLGLAVFVNWYYTKNGTPLSPEGASPAAQEDGLNDGAAALASASEEDYFATVKLNREKTLAAALEELETVMASADDSADDVSAVREKIAALTQAAKLQTDIESLVSAQVGGECVAVAGENGLEVIVSKGALTEENVLRISDIVRGVCGSTFENVRVAAVS